MPRACTRLAELFPGRTVEEIVTDCCMPGSTKSPPPCPTRPVPKIISRDDQGDPVYEDVGLTPRFVELTRKFKKSLQAAALARPAA